jgi:Calcineurin-like phosphoesterase
MKILASKRPCRVSFLAFLWLCVSVCQADDEEEDALSDPEFRLFSRSLYHAEQEPFRSFPCLPKHIHLAQANNVDPSSGTLSMTVSFTLDYKDCHWKELRPFIRYAAVNAVTTADSSSTARIVVAVHPPLQFNYTSDKTHGQVFQSDWIYHLELPGVRAGDNLYWYRIAVPALDKNVEASRVTSPRHRSVRGSNGYYLGETPTYTFRSPPLPGAPTSLALVGDIGQTKDSLQTMIDIYEAAVIGRDDDNDDSKHAISHLLIAGDLSYADADPARWTSWMALIEPLVRSLPLHVAAGNHEVECTTEHQIFLPYENYFRMPNRLGEAITEGISDEERAHFLWGCDAPSDFLGVYNYGNSFYRYVHFTVRRGQLSSCQLIIMSFVPAITTV